MTQIDISSYSVSDLKSLQAQIAMQLESKQAAQLAGAKEQIMALAKEHGIDLKTLLSTAKAPGKKAAIKYRDPNNSKNQWTGRGRAPGWVASMKAAGTLESARVQ